MGAPGVRDVTGAVTVPSKFSLCAGAAAGLCRVAADAGASALNASTAAMARVTMGSVSTWGSSFCFLSPMRAL